MSYSILSNPEKRENYDLAGDNKDNMFTENVNPFEMFNQIFKNHVHSFMNFNTQNNNLHNIINKLRENGSQIYGIYSNISQNMNDSDFSNHQNDPFNFMMNRSKNTSRNKSKISSYSTNSYKSNQSKPYKRVPDYEKVDIKRNNKTNKTKTNKNNKIKGKPKLIKMDVEATIEEVYNYTRKKIKIPISNVKEKNYEIPLVGRELLINGIGHNDMKYTEKGDVKIKINIKEHEIYSRMNNYDLLLKYNISIYDFYHKKELNIKLPDNTEEIIDFNYKDVLKSNNNFDNYIIKINNKGLPKLYNKERGVLIIKLNVQLPLEYDDLME